MTVSAWLSVGELTCTPSNLLASFTKDRRLVTFILCIQCLFIYYNLQFVWFFVLTSPFLFNFTLHKRCGATMKVACESLHSLFGFKSGGLMILHKIQCKD